MPKKKNSSLFSPDNIPKRTEECSSAYERIEEYINPYLYVGKEPNLKRVGGSGSGKTRFFKKPNLMPKK